MPIAKNLSVGLDGMELRGYVREGKIFLKLEVFIDLLESMLHEGFLIGY